MLCQYYLLRCLAHLMVHKLKVRNQVIPESHIGIVIIGKECEAYPAESSDLFGGTSGFDLPRCSNPR